MRKVKGFKAKITIISDVFKYRPMSPDVVFLLHQHKEVSEAGGALNGVGQIRLQHGAERRLSPQFPQPFDVAGRLAGIPLNDGQSVFPAQFIGAGANPFVIVPFAEMRPLSCPGIDGV